MSNQAKRSPDPLGIPGTKPMHAISAGKKPLDNAFIAEATMNLLFQQQHQEGACYDGQQLPDQ